MIMYARHFGFTADPFKLTADAQMFYRSSGHGKALAYLTYGIAQGEGFIIITGEVGTGKTTIIRYLLDHLDLDQHVAAQIVTSNLRGEDMIHAIAAAFGLDPAGSNKAVVLRKLEQFLIATRKSGKRAILIVDECQNLSIEALEELRMISNYQLDGLPLLQSFLIGQPGFRAMLALPDLEQLMQRVSASYHLCPLSVSESQAYIEHRLRSVGWNNRPSFQAEAFPAIFRGTDGVPRRINRLCSRLMLACQLDNIDSIEAILVNQTARDLRSELGSATRQEHAATGDSMPVTLGPNAATADIRALDERMGATEARIAKIEDTVEKHIEASRTLLVGLKRA